MKKLVFLFVACISLQCVTYAQLHCGTDELQQTLINLNPQFAEKGTVKPTGSAWRTTSISDTNTYDVPVVIHIIHDYGAENLNDDSIYVAFKAWADVFMKQNADTAAIITPFKKYIGNTKVRLHLATKDPSGKPTKGITRTQSYLTVDGAEQAKFQQWPPDKYINIWFVKSIGWATAFAYLPAYALAYQYYDGVMSMASFANNDNTVPHEMGHYFNLQHIWGTNACGTDCSSTDSVDDTPPTKGHTYSMGCLASALYDTICATGYMVHYTDIFGGDSVVDYPDTVNTQNIMDYSSCSIMFTMGQSARMRASMTSPIGNRNHLITTSTLAATGALDPWPDLLPVPDFIINKAVGAGSITDLRSYFLTIGNTGSFQFSNASWNDTITGVSWAFSNGATTPTSSGMTTVDNKFSLPGWVTVNLTATSNAGSNSITDTHAVYVADTTPVGGAGYTQTFSSTAAISNWPMFNYYNNQFKWEFYTGAGKDDNSCVRYISFDASSSAIPSRIIGTARGDFDDLFTPAFNLSGTIGSLYLNFFTTGASTLTGIGSTVALTLDTLEVFASIDGGAHWQKIKTFDGYDLQNNGTFNTSFIPGATSVWEPRTIDVPVALRSRNTFFRFRYRPGNTGNNLYLDNFYLYPFPVGVKEALTTAPNSLSIFPNPAANGCNIVFKAGFEGHVSFAITDIVGKLIYSRIINVIPQSVINEPIDKAKTPVPGMYFVTLTIDGVKQVQKLIVKP